MLGLQVFVQVDEACLTPVPQNILNELDGVTKGLGITRYTGEKGKYYKEPAQQIANLAFDSPEQQHMLFGLELRAPLEFAVIENTSIDSIMNKVDVLDGHKLRIVTYTPGTQGALYSSSTNTYDLLDRNSYPFLEEVFAHATRNSAGFRAYISPLGHGRFNHILPYHLAPVQKNYLFQSAPFQNSTSFYLDHKYILPDTMKISSGNMPDNEAAAIRFVDNAASIVNPGDVYVNFWTGQVQTGTDISKYDAFLSYKVVHPVFRFMITPGSTIFSYASTDVAARLNAYDDPNCTLKSHRYLQSSANVLEGYTYSGAKVSPKLAFMFEEGNLHDNNLNRWG